MNSEYEDETAIQRSEFNILDDNLILKDIMKICLKYIPK